MIPSFDDSTTISLLTMINGTLIKDTGKKDIGAFCCYSLIIKNCTCIIKKDASAFCTLFLNAFQKSVFIRLVQQTKQRIKEKFGSIAQHKVNQVFDYSNNDGENLRQISLYLTYRGGTKLYPLQWVTKTLQFQYNLKLEHSQVSNVLGDQAFLCLKSQR